MGSQKKNNLTFPLLHPPFSSPDQHPLPPECPVQPPVPALHRGHPVHRREPGALQPQAHAEPSPEATALPWYVHQIPSEPEIRLLKYRRVLGFPLHWSQSGV